MTSECTRVDGVVFLNVFRFDSVMIGQRLCADVFRSLMLWTKISFASGVTDRIMGRLMNGCRS